jgi:parvulin-like peptidyl-prolyl isomerase
MKEFYRRQNTKLRVEYLEFQTREFFSAVGIDEQGLEKFFEEHKADYHVPEKVRLRYLRLTPRDYEDEVRALPDDLEAYYDENRSTYEIPERAKVEGIFLPAADYVDDVTVTEDVLETYLGMYKEEFRLPERRAIRYTHIPVEVGGDSPQLPLQEVREYYEKHITEYEVRQEETKAQQILLVLAPDASPGEEQRVLSRLREIQAEIKAGKPFEEAAKEYSEDQLTNEKGGDLGWFGHRNISPGPEITDVAFALQVGQISEPFRTSRGYHILRAVDRKAERTRPLEEVEENLRKNLAGQKLQRIRYEAREFGFTEEVVGATYPLVLSEPFARRDEAIGQIPADDAPRVAGAAFGTATGEISTVITGDKNFYLLEVVEVLPPRDQTLEEVRDEVRETYVNSRAKRLAERAAANGVRQVQAEGVPFPDMARELGKEIRRIGPFQQGDELPDIGEAAETFIKSILALETGQITTVGGDEGVHLVRVAAYEPSRIPDLEEVEERVRGGVRKQKAVGRTEEIANDVLGILEENEAFLADAVRLASAAMGVSIPERSLGETEPIGEDDYVQITGWGANVTRAGLRLNEVGNHTQEPIPVRAGARARKISDFFLAELLEKIPEHEPELEEVREDVERDYRFHLAAQLAEQKATETYRKLQEAVASTELAHASKTVDLVSFARRVDAQYAASEEPFSVEAPWSTPFYRAESVLKTIYQLDEGELSSLIEVIEQVGSGEEKKERVRGHYIVQVVDRQEAGMDEFPAAKEDIVMRLNRRAVTTAYEAWVESLKRSADVERHESLEKQLAYERGEISEEEYLGMDE